jgi:hypothetical protein
MNSGKWKMEAKDKEGVPTLFLVVVDIKSNWTLSIETAFSVF